MITPAVNVFFYGSYMNFHVLQEVDIGERDFTVGTIRGYELTIAPLANLVTKESGIVYGILTRLTHAELERLYRYHANKILGGEYLPEAVVVSRLDKEVSPALCYISYNMEKKKADAGYVDRILQPARACGFPQWYLDHIASFR